MRRKETLWFSYLLISIFTWNEREEYIEREFHDQERLKKIFPIDTSEVIKRTISYLPSVQLFQMYSYCLKL